MVYKKNLPLVERILRVLGGVALIAYGLMGMRGLPLGYVLALSGLVAILTGFVGFCPMCALAGRRTLQAIQKQREEKGL